MKEIIGVIECRTTVQDVLRDGKERYVAPGLSMRVNYSNASVHLILDKNQQYLLSDITLVQKQLEKLGWTLSAQRDGEGFWEGTFV